MAGLADVLYLAALPRATGDRQKAAPQHSQTWETGMGRKPPDDGLAENPHGRDEAGVPLRRPRRASLGVPRPPQIQGPEEP
jgi:hypothetical protein